MNAEAWGRTGRRLASNPRTYHPRRWRIAPRRELELHDGDVVILCEIGRNQAARYRLRIHPEAHQDLVFSSFTQAAVEGELLAGRLGAWLMLLEDDVPSLLADRRRHR